MKLYHGSNIKIDKVELSLCKKFKDFGKGFYLTPDYSRAVLMALRRTEIENNGEPVVNPFIMFSPREEWGLNILEFKTNNWEWAKFIMNNRNKEDTFLHHYDIVIGPVADSRVDPIIRDYKKEYKTDYLLKENLAVLGNLLKYPGQTYMQYCFCTEKSLQYLIRD